MEQEHVYYCIGCNSIHNRRDFYTSFHPIHKNNTYPFCKDYIKNTVYLSDEIRIDVEKFQDLLRQMDAPFLIDVWESAMDAQGETIGEYFKIINMKHNRGLKWENSIFNYGTNSESNTPPITSMQYGIANLSKHEIRELEDRWGFGYSVEELFLFEKKYQLLQNNYTEQTAMHTEALFNYIRYRVKEEMATAEGNIKDAKEWGSLANKAATAAKINPSQLSKADLSGGLSTFSELSLAVEKEVDIINILPRFRYRPNDAIDFNIWCYVNYIRDLSGLPLCSYEDIYKFYDERKQDYINQYGDPYGIFDGDTTEKNRENIQQFIHVEDVV